MVDRPAVVWLIDQGQFGRLTSGCLVDGASAVWYVRMGQWLHGRGTSVFVLVGSVVAW
jgi:hypothetical protein